MIKIYPNKFFKINIPKYNSSTPHHHHTTTTTTPPPPPHHHHHHTTTTTMATAAEGTGGRVLMSEAFVRKALIAFENSLQEALSVGWSTHSLSLLSNLFTHSPPLTLSLSSSIFLLLFIIYLSHSPSFHFTFY